MQCMNFIKIERFYVGRIYQVSHEIPERDARICTLKKCPLCENHMQQTFFQCTLKARK